MPTGNNDANDDKGRMVMISSNCDDFFEVDGCNGSFWLSPNYFASRDKVEIDSTLGKFGYGKSQQNGGNGEIFLNFSQSLTPQLMRSFDASSPIPCIKKKYIFIDLNIFEHFVQHISGHGRSGCQTLQPKEEQVSLFSKNYNFIKHEQ